MSRMRADDMEAVQIIRVNKEKSKPIHNPWGVWSFYVDIDGIPAPDWVAVLEKVRKGCDVVIRCEDSGILLECMPDDLQDALDELRRDIEAANNIAFRIHEEKEVERVHRLIDQLTF